MCQGGAGASECNNYKQQRSHTVATARIITSGRNGLPLPTTVASSRFVVLVVVPVCCGGAGAVCQGGAGAVCQGGAGACVPLLRACHRCQTSERRKPASSTVASECNNECVRQHCAGAGAVCPVMCVCVRACVRACVRVCTRLQQDNRKMAAKKMTVR